MDYRDLPYDAEIEYLGSDGHSYLNTGICPNYSDNVELIFKLSDIASSTRDNLSFFGAFRSWAKDAFNHAWNNANQFCLPIGGHPNQIFATNESNYTNNWHSFVLKGTNCILDGDTKTVSRAAGATNVPMYVFASNQNNLYVYGYGTKRYFKNFKLLDSNNIPKLDLIPVRVGNVGYMYDRVSGQLFGNSGTGSFVLGPDVAPGRYANEVAFLESTGSQYIDTGIIPNNTYTFDTKVTPLQNTNTTYWGVRNSGTYSTRAEQCYLNNNYGQQIEGVNRIRLWTDSTETDCRANSWDSGIVPVVNTQYSFTGITVYSELHQLSLPITLFGLNNVGTVSFHGTCRIASWVAYSNGVKVADFVPVEYNNIGYMYDKVSGGFFANQGTGKFVLGHRAPRFDGKACARSYSRRKALLNTENPPLGYEWCDYIENTSSAYINTGLKGKANLKIDATWLFKQSEVVGLMGASYNHEPYNNALLYRANSGSSSYFYYGNSWGATSALTLNKKWHIVMDKGKLYYNDVLKKTYTTTGDSAYNFMFFRVADHNSYVKGQLFGCKIYDDDILVRDYRPIKRLSDNKYGLWDKVEKRFYTSASSSNFTGG